MATLGVRGTNGAQGPTRGTGKDVSQREDLANFITMITRDETPFISSIGKAKATSIYHEWQTDTLDVPGNSVIGEGTDWLAPTVNGGGAIGTDGAFFNKTGPYRTRLGNYTQINGKALAVSGTRRAVDMAGVADEYAYQLKKRGTELRRDVEHDMIHSFNTSALASPPTGAPAGRKASGYQAFINNAATVDTVGGWIVPAAASQGNGSAVVKSNAAAAGQPAKGTLALTTIDSVMQQIYEQGGKATKIMISPKLRRDFSDLMISDTGVIRNIDEKGKLRQSVDVYMSDFGDLMVVPNYIMGLTNAVQFTQTNGTTALGATTDVANFSALIYDPQWFAMATLRPLKEVDVGARGDSTVGMMVEEQTLEVRNPIGCGAIYGLN